MPTPSAALGSLRPELAGALEEINLAAQRAGYIGLEVLPTFDVAKQSGKFGKVSLEQLLQIKDTSRKPGGPYKRGEWEFTEDSFTTEEKGWEEPVDERESALYTDFVDAEMVAAARAQHFVLQNLEIDIAAMVFNTTTFASGNSNASAVSNAWSSSANATPFDDVDTAVRGVWNNTGLVPNAVILNWFKLRHLINTAQFRDRVASSGAGSSTMAGSVTLQQVANFFDVEKVIVAGGAKNTANEAQSRTIAHLWDTDKVMVAKLATGNDIREPGLGRTFHWTGDGSAIDGRVESYPEPQTRSEIIRRRFEVGSKLIYPNCGYLLTSV